MKCSLPWCEEEAWFRGTLGEVIFFFCPKHATEFQEETDEEVKVLDEPPKENRR